jgi:hypothetical protein
LHYFRFQPHSLFQRKLRTAKKESVAAQAEQAQPRYEPIDYEEDLDFSLQVAPSAHHADPDSPVKTSADHPELKVS